MSIEAMRLALDALEEYQEKGPPFMSCDGAVVALRTAIEQSEKPVACMCGICKLGKREWVGLTDEEVDDIWNTYCDEMGAASINDADDIASAVEAKLKEKNAY